MRGLAAALCATALLACEDTGLGAVDAGAGSDAALAIDAAAAAEDASAPSDAGVRDAGACPPLGAASSSTSFAHTDGLASVLEYHAFVEGQGVRHWRQWQVGAFSRALEPTASDPYLWDGIPADGCIVRNLPAANADLRPFRNLGLYLTWHAASGDEVRWERHMDGDGPYYLMPSGPVALKFSDPAQTPFDQVWTWSTPGDPGAFIDSASAELAPVEDFELTPTLTATSAPVPLSAGTALAWTPPRATPGVFSIVLSRATSPAGDARAVICRPADDGSFTITQAMLDALAPTPGVAFGFDVGRSQRARLCNAGVRNGVAAHTIAHLGRAVVR